MSKVGILTLEFTRKTRGKVTLTGRVVVAADGENGTITESGTDANSKKVSITAVFDKQ